MSGTYVTHKAIGVAAVGALAFGLASCGDDGDSNSEVSAPMSVESDPAEDDLDLRSQELPTSAQQAVDIAAEHVAKAVPFTLSSLITLILSPAMCGR